MPRYMDVRGFWKTILFGIFSALLVQTVLGEGDAKWGYYDAAREEQPYQWKYHFKACGGKQQSPIALSYYYTWLPEENFDNFTFYGFRDNSVNRKIKVTNDGHTVVFTPQANYYVEGGGLYGKYKLAQFHLHWGYIGNRGSEHILDGVQYAAEIHFVMYSNSYNEIGQALGKLGGVAVLGVFVKEVDGPDNPYFRPLIKYLRRVSFPEYPSTYIPGIRLGDLFPRNMKVFYRYKGSLTTPPCTERLTWTVFDEPITVSKAQMNVLRTNLLHHGKSSSGQTVYKTLTDNYRPVQYLHSRTVYVSQGRY